MKIAIGCDDAAYGLKNQLKDYLEQSGFALIDVGVYDEAPSHYPDIAQILCEKIRDKSVERGILLCGTGIGMSITANKVPGVRAAVVHDVFSAERSIKSNDCQVLCMGARVVAFEYAKVLVDKWLESRFTGGPSAKKVERIVEIERHYAK